MEATLKTTELAPLREFVIIMNERRKYDLVHLIPKEAVVIGIGENVVVHEPGLEIKFGDSQTGMIISRLFPAKELLDSDDLVVTQITYSEDEDAVVNPMSSKDFYELFFGEGSTKFKEYIINQYQEDIVVLFNITCGKSENYDRVKFIQK